MSFLYCSVYNSSFPLLSMFLHVSVELCSVHWRQIVTYKIEHLLVFLLVMFCFFALAVFTDTEPTALVLIDITFSCFKVGSTTTTSEMLWYERFCHVIKCHKNKKSGQVSLKGTCQDSMVLVVTCSLSFVPQKRMCKMLEVIPYHRTRIRLLNMCMLSRRDMLYCSRS